MPDDVVIEITPLVHKGKCLAMNVPGCRRLFVHDQEDADRLAEYLSTLEDEP